MKDIITSTRPDSGAHTERHRENLPFLLALIAAGVAGNFLGFSLFLNIDFLFGSIFALLVLQRFGLKRGVIAAALISTYTIILWNHPYNCVILTAEVAAVGWLFPRRKIGLVLADTLYWLCLGMPLIYFFYHGVMDVSWENTRIIMTKQALNGIANALIARLLFAGYTLFSRQQLLPLREIVSTLLGLFVLCPALLILTLDGRADFVAIDQQIRTTLILDREVMSERLQYWLYSRKASVLTLASLAATLSPPEMQSRLEQARASDPNFQRVGLLDQTATTVAFTPLFDELGQATIGKNYADRPFIPLLKKNLQPMLSEVVMSRIGSPQAVAHILAPVVTKAGYGGFVVGALNLERIEKMLTVNAAKGGQQRFTLIDRHGRIITTNNIEQKVMTPFERRPGKEITLTEGIAQWIPILPGNVPIMERWKKSYYRTEANIGEFSEWRLILEQPVAPFQKQLYDIYSRKMTLLFIVLFGALLFAELMSRLITHTNEELLTITSDLPTRLSGDYPIAWPKSAISETNRLIENFRSMSATLSTQFNDIRKINSSLEERVKTRTRELTESRERYDLALLGSQDGIWDWDVLTNEVYFSARCYEMLGYTKKELEPTFALFEDLIHADDLATVREKVRQHHAERTSYSVEFRMRKKDGRYNWILARGQALWDEEGQVVRMAGSHTDISERKKVEKQILASLREKEVLLKEVHHRVKNNLQIVYSLLALQASRIIDRDIRAHFDESRHRIGSMALIHDKIYCAKDLSHIDFNQYLQELAQNIANTYQRPDIILAVEKNPVYLDVNSGIPCGLIVNELVSNSFKYAFPAERSGQITIGLTSVEGDAYLLTVEDNGVGFPEDIDFRNTTSLGLQLVTILTGQLQGEIVLTTEAGTKFSIHFPAQTQ